MSEQNSLLRQQLRRTMRARRLSLSQAEQQQAAQNLRFYANTLLERYRPNTLAFYLPFNGEISPLVLLNHCLTQGNICTLPVLHPFSPHYLQFVQYRSESDLIPNRFGILEPKLDVRNIVPLNEIDMIFVPLVACDKQNNRLGMGGGFYDRTLAYMPQAVTVGLAHRCQQVDQLPIESWDIPLRHLLLG